MAKKTFIIEMDNTIQPGDHTKDQIVSTLAAQGVTTNAANPVRDPITNKLLYVEVSLPSTASNTAAEAIANNPGKARASVAIPEPLPALPLDAEAGIAFSGDWTWEGTGVMGDPVDKFSQMISFGGIKPYVRGGISPTLGILYGDDTFSAGGTFEADLMLGMRFRNESLVDYSIPDGSITLKFLDGSEYVFESKRSQAAIIPAKSSQFGADPSLVFCGISRSDTEGKFNLWQFAATDADGNLGEYWPEASNFFRFYVEGTDARDSFF